MHCYSQWELGFQLTPTSLVLVYFPRFIGLKLTDESSVFEHFDNAYEFSVYTNDVYCIQTNSGRNSNSLTRICAVAVVLPLPLAVRKIVLVFWSLRYVLPRKHRVTFRNGGGGGDRRPKMLIVRIWQTKNINGA